MILEKNLSHDLKNTFNEIKKEILFKKNYFKAAQMIEAFLAVDGPYFNELLAVFYFQKRSYDKAKEMFNLLDNKYQEGFCELLLGNKDRAAEIWDSAPDSPAVQWGKCVLGFINLKLTVLPSFLQIRNFLEHDLEQFIRANRIEYAENIVNCSEILAEINPETYKFIGKVLFNSGYPGLAFEQFCKSCNLIPNDPEIYYHLARYHHLEDDFNESRKMIKRCLEINENYTPAKVLLQKIEEA